MACDEDDNEKKGLLSLMRKTSSGIGAILNFMHDIHCWMYSIHKYFLHLLKAAHKAI